MKNKMKFEKYSKTFAIYRPINNKNNCLEYVLYCGKVDPVINRILEKYNIEVYDINYNTGMTEYSCYIETSFNTDENIMVLALQEIIEAISKKQYIF